jgi:hypothetical protein
MNHEKAEGLERLLRSGLITPRDYRIQFEALIKEGRNEILDFIYENGTASEGIERLFDEYDTLTETQRSSHANGSDETEPPAAA